MSDENKDAPRGIAILGFIAGWVLSIRYWMRVYDLTWGDVWPFAIGDGFVLLLLFGGFIGAEPRPSDREEGKGK